MGVSVGIKAGSPDGIEFIDAGDAATLAVGQAVWEYDAGEIKGWVDAGDNPIPWGGLDAMPVGVYIGNNKIAKQPGEYDAVHSLADGAYFMNFNPAGFPTADDTLTDIFLFQVAEPNKIRLTFNSLIAPDTVAAPIPADGSATGSPALVPASLADQTNFVGEDVTYSVGADFNDVDTPIVFSCTGHPPGITINSTTGAFQGRASDGLTSLGTPTRVYTVSVIATDATGAATTETFNWTINHTTLMEWSAGNTLNPSLTLTTTSAFEPVVDFGDGNVIAGTGGPGSKTIAHNYGALGGYPMTVRVDPFATTIFDFRNSGLFGSLPDTIGDLTLLTEVRLNGNSFTGQIPVLIGNMTGLTILHLDGNQFSGAFPVQFGALTSLLELNLQNNLLSGPIPTQIGTMTALQRLNLFGNSFNNTLPDEIGNLVNILIFNVSDNEFSGALPTTIGALVLARVFNVSKNQLTGNIPTEIGGMVDLRSFNVSENMITGPIPIEIGLMLQLTTLNLQDNQLDGSIPVEIGNLVDLVTLNAYNNLLTGIVPATIGNCVLLETIFISQNQLTGNLPTTIGALVNLTLLNIFNNLMTGPLPVEMRFLTALERFNGSNNDMGGAFPQPLVEMIALEQFILSNNSFSTSEISQLIIDIDAVAATWTAAAKDVQLQTQDPAAVFSAGALTAKANLEANFGFTIQP